MQSNALRVGGLGASKTPAATSTSSSSQPQAPLGTTSTANPTTPRGSAKKQESAVSRALYPVDLGATSLPGPIVTCVSVQDIVTSGGAHLFLALVDDPRGSSSTQPGAYSAYWITLLGGQFQVHSPNQGPTALPRLSAAVAAHDRVYASAGRAVWTLQPPLALTDSIATAASARRRPPTQVIAKLPTLYFGPRAWPGPVRCGPDAIAVVANGRVVVGCVGHAFYATASMVVEQGEDDDEDDGVEGMYSTDPTRQGTGPNRGAVDCIKLVHWTQSSQVHPVVTLDMKDQSIVPHTGDRTPSEWSSLFLANGRECVVVDLYFGPLATQPRLSASPPRNGIVTTASPILAAAASWPYISILMSDGLISVRSPSCLAVSLRTVEVGTRPNDFFTLRTVDTTSKPKSNQRLSVWGSDPPSSSSISTAWSLPSVVGISYGGEAKVLACRPDSFQELSDRCMRLTIDAFGPKDFPRTELAQAVAASFTATSYVGPEASPQARALLQQYLQALLGLCDWESGASSGWPTSSGNSGTSHEDALVFGDSVGGLSHTTLAEAGEKGGGFHGKWSDQSEKNRNAKPFSSVLTAAQPAALLTSSALLCLVVASNIRSHGGSGTMGSSSPSFSSSSLASRAAKACAAELGVVMQQQLDAAAISVGQQVTEQLLLTAKQQQQQAFSLSSSSSGSSSASTPKRIGPAQQQQIATDLIEAAIWLLRSCGQHDRSMQVAAERLSQRPSSYPKGVDASSRTSSRTSGQWSRIKYESYTATHLSDLWCCGQEEARELVLRSNAAHDLLESNPSLGLSVFTALHPQNETQWRETSPRDDPFRNTKDTIRVLDLLKAIRPKLIPKTKEESTAFLDNLPLETGRALAVTFLESSIGITTGRPATATLTESLQEGFDNTPLKNASEDSHEQSVSNFHDELALLLLEGVISERSDDDSKTADVGEEDSELGAVYRRKLRDFLRWPGAKLRPERFLESLPPSFLPEKALILGRLERHEDAIRILYRDLQSLDLALEYCDDRHKRQQQVIASKLASRVMMSSSGAFADKVFDEAMPQNDDDNAYLPLVRVALESEDTSKGCAAVIQVLALRRNAIDRAAALRLLPSDIPVSAVARPFLIPALVDSESQVRRLTVVSALLRARYLRLKEQLTSAQLKAQANLQVVPQLQSLELGDPLHSTKQFRARASATSSSTSSSLPEVWIVKHFFPRHLVIQARVTNQAALSEKTGRTLTDICFVVAESSEDAIQPLLQVPIAMLPSGMTGCTWCVLSAAPARMEGTTAQLTCELRYTVSAQGDVMAAMNPQQQGAMMGRTFVEELQDLEVHATHF